MQQEACDWTGEREAELRVAEKEEEREGEGAKMEVDGHDDSESVWPYEEAENGAKVITFYSFKGGMGRTTALAGVALCLVKQGRTY